MDRLARGCLTVSSVLIVALFQTASVLAFQSPQSSRERTSSVGARGPEVIVSRLLRENPVTAPSMISATWKNGAVVLSGRVGTSVVHDIAVRTVIDLGYPVRDDLMIDTAEAHRVAQERTAAESWPAPGQAQPALVGSAPYFVYPPPLFGRVDDPFFGFEPPLVSFPPWAGGAGPALGLAPGMPMPPQRPGTVLQSQPPADLAPAKGNIRLTVDAAGQVFLSGVVASEEDRRTIEAEARNTPGVSRVSSELQVAPRSSETPPPPPQPHVPPPPQPQPPQPQRKADAGFPSQPPGEVSLPRPAAGAPRSVPAELAMARDGRKLTRRVAESLSRCAPLAALPISVQSRGDTVSLSGKVPSAYEAMLAYRAVEQTPGVRDIADRLQFQLPDEDHPNPLRCKGRPEDIEAYLLSQTRRHLGDLAHVDQLRVRGDLVEIRGTLAR
ncbi:MAG: BON domain-containing protein, partial [Planctomycetaceae bacterium]|nr:BON domain-containing protein [Planctomycetaceae bacterium]